MKNYIKVEYRDIAKMLVKSMPLEGEDFGAKVEEYLSVVKKLPGTAKLALKSAYVFSSKCPRQDREDLFQDLCLAILKAGTKDEKLAYSIARCDWQNWWQKRFNRADVDGGSLDATVEDADGNEVLARELLVGEVEMEAKVIGNLDAVALWQKLPGVIKTLVQKRLMGKALAGKERILLCRWLKSEGAEALLN